MLSRRHFLGASAGLIVPTASHARRGSAERDLIRRAMDGIDPKRFLDAHVHVVGVGHGDTGCSVHPNMTDMWSHPLQWIRFRMYAEASGVKDLDNIDANYLRVLRERTEGLPTGGRSLLFAFDQVHDENGKPQPKHTVFHVPDAHMFAAVASADHFLP